MAYGLQSTVVGRLRSVCRYLFIATSITLVKRRSTPDKKIPTAAEIMITDIVNLVISALVGQATFLSSSVTCFIKTVGSVIYFKSAQFWRILSNIIANFVSIFNYQLSISSEFSMFQCIVYCKFLPAGRRGKLKIVNCSDIINLLYETYTKSRHSCR